MSNNTITLFATQNKDGRPDVYKTCWFGTIPVPFLFTIYGCVTLDPDINYGSYTFKDTLVVF